MIFYMLDTNNLLKELKRKCFIIINPSHTDFNKLI